MSAPLTPDDAAAVLRRAAELDAASLGPHDALDEQVVRDAAREVGLSEAAVDRAVAEWRAGVLEPLPDLSPDVRAGLLATVAVESRVLLPPDVAAERMQAWLRGQWFERRRVRGNESEWAPRPGLLAGARRAVDVQKRLRLSGVGKVRLCVAPAAQGSRVRLVADLGDARSGMLAGLVAAPALIAGGVVGMGLGLDGNAGVEVLLALPSAVGAGGLGWLGARRVLASRRATLSEDLEQVLDELAAAPLKRSLPERAAAWAAQRPALRLGPPSRGPDLS